MAFSPSLRAACPEMPRTAQSSTISPFSAIAGCIPVGSPTTANVWNDYYRVDVYDSETGDYIRTVHLRIYYQLPYLVTTIGELSNGGIILSDDALKPRNVGVVEAIGPLVRADIKVGDTVLFHCFDDLPTYDPEVVMVRDNSLLGVFA